MENAWPLNNRLCSFMFIITMRIVFPSGAVMKNHPKAKVPDIESEIGETLKHAPFKRGAANKVTKCF